MPKTVLQTSLTALEEQQQLLEQELQELTDEDIAEFSELSQSVTGIGPKSSSLLMIYTNGMKNFSSKAQLPKFLGTGQSVKPIVVEHPLMSKSPSPKVVRQS